MQLESFNPLRCIRQGNPLSSYLFILYLEVLSYHIISAVDGGSCKGIKLSRHGPMMSHLCFANDLLFAVATKKALIMERVLQFFSGFFGQRVDMEKSQLLFSSNVRSDLDDRLLDKFGIPTSKDFAYTWVCLFCIEGLVKEPTIW